MKLMIQIVSICFVFSFFEIPNCWANAFEVKGRVRTLALNGPGTYRVTLDGFTKVLYVDQSDKAFKCIEASVKHSNPLVVNMDFDGKILTCK